MIFDNLSNCGIYAVSHPLFREAFDFLGRPDLSSLQCGKIDIGTHGVFALLQEYDTRSVVEAFVECHRKYIDIQFIVRGEERMGFGMLPAAAEVSYDPEKDLGVTECRLDYLVIHEREFAIFFPQDAHSPGLDLEDGKRKVRKVCVKVPVAG